MQHDKLALLRTLALRPSREVPQSLLPVLEELVREGHVAREDGAGWMATAKGCGLLEDSRPPRMRRR